MLAIRPIYLLTTHYTQHARRRTHYVT